MHRRFSARREVKQIYGRNYSSGSPPFVHVVDYFRIARYARFIRRGFNPPHSHFSLMCSDRFDSRVDKLAPLSFIMSFGSNYRQRATSELICGYPHVFVGYQANTVEWALRKRLQLMVHTPTYQPDAADPIV